MIISESKLRNIIAEAVSSVLMERFTFHDYRTATVAIDTEEAFPSLTDDSEVPYEIHVNATYDYEPPVKANYYNDTPPCPASYSFVKCEPADKTEWTQFVQASGIPEEQLLNELEMYVEDKIEEIGSQNEEESYW